MPVTTPRPVDKATARGDLMEALIPDAAYLAVAVRDRDPADIAARLAGLSRYELEALAVLLAGMVDPGRSVADLLGWIDFDEHGRPLGGQASRAELPLHRKAREPRPPGIGPDHAAALRVLEGERLELRAQDRALAVRMAVMRGWTDEEIAAALGMTVAAVQQAWNRIKQAAREAGLSVPRRPDRPGRNEVAS